MDEKDFTQWFYGSPIKRARFEGLRRNVAIAMGNSGLARYVPQLEEWSGSDDSVLHDVAIWAIGKIRQAQAGSGVTEYVEDEPQ